MAVELPSLLALFDRYQRIDITYPDMHREAFPHLVRFSRPAPGMSFVLYSRLDETNVDKTIRDQIAYFSARSLPFEWKVYGHDTPSSLGERLAVHGLTPEEPESVLVLDVQQASEALLEPIQVDVRLLTERQQLTDVIRVLEGVWGDDFSWVTQRLGAHMEIPGHLSVYVAHHQGQPACTGWTYFHANNPFASLWGGSTLEAFRHQGIYTAILAARVQEARHRGVPYLTVDASPMSQPILAKHGFRVLTTAQGFEWKPEP
jgi:GNAT superfamily N-acetyltransferase